MNVIIKLSENEVREAYFDVSVKFSYYKSRLGPENDYYKLEIGDDYYPVEFDSNEIFFDMSVPLADCLVLIFNKETRRWKIEKEPKKTLFLEDLKRWQYTM